MNRCEHGQKISKFCITEHCHHRESAGCDYCIKKYHFHLTNTQLLLEPQIESLLKTFTLPTDSKYKSRALSEASLDYLRSLRHTINEWIDAAQNAITERLSFPILHNHGLLVIYNRLKNKEYRKFTAAELKALNDFAKNNSPENIKKQEHQLYFRQVQWTRDLVDATSKLAQEIEALPQMKEGQNPQIISKTKLNDIYSSIQRERQKRDNSVSKDTGNQNSARKSERPIKPLTRMEETVQPSSLMRRRYGDKEDLKKRDSIPKADIIRQVIDRKLLTEAERESITPPRAEFTTPNTEKTSEKPTQRTQSNDQKMIRSKNRKYSIEEGLIEIKFRGSEEVARQIQQRKRKLLESMAPKKYNQEQKQVLNKTATEPSDRSEKIDNFNSTNSSKTDREAVVVKPMRPIQEIRKHKIFNRDRSDKMAHPIKEENNNIGMSQMQKSDSSSKKASQKSIFDTLQAKGLNLPEIINNILPPLPPTAPKPETQAVMTNMIVKIPMGMRQNSDEIQSPIFKNKRKMDKAHNHNSFSIKLQQASSESPQHLPTVHQTQKQDNTPVPVVKSQPLSQTESQTIFLQSKQKNSLLLFCEALKSQSAKAIELLKASLRYSPNNLSAAQYLSYLYLQNGNAKQCLEICESILVLIEDKSDEFELTLHLHNNKAAALNMLGRYSESIVVLQKCLRFRRKHFFYKNLGDAYFSLGIPEKAAMNYDKAIRLDPAYDEAYYNLAVSQFIQQEYTSAKLNIEHALKIDSVNESYVELSAQITKRLENIHRS